MNWSVLTYKFNHWVFQWKLDDEKDLTFVLFGFINFTKYKEHTIIRFGKVCKEFAPKYLN